MLMNYQETTDCTYSSIHFFKKTVMLCVVKFALLDKSKTAFPKNDFATNGQKNVISMIKLNATKS